MSAAVGQPPASNTGATFTTSPRWDYSATTHTDLDPASFSTLVPTLWNLLGGGRLVKGKGAQGWLSSLAVYGEDDNLRGTIYSGGRDDVYCLVSGGVSDEVREAITRVGNASTSRVDTRVDTLAGYEEVARLLRLAADKAGAEVTTMRKDVRGVNKGQTMYVGAPSSRIRVRLYEKWLESPGQYVEGTNRVEVQLRPHSTMKRAVSGWARAETFACSPMCRNLAELLQLEGSSVVSLQSGPKEVADLDRSIAAMRRQYSKTAREYVVRKGGDVDALLVALRV